MSAKAKDMFKNGWHPEKNGSSIRGSVSGMLGRGKKDDDSSSNHVAPPISSLRDPASFAPPPKRTGTGLAPAPPPSGGGRKVVPAPSKYQDPRRPAVTPPPQQSQPFSAPQQEQGVEQVSDPESPRRPYRVNTSGLSTDHLPKPPGRKDGADGREPPPPPSYETATGAPGRAPPPRLPPRLPPRTNSGSTAPVLAPLSTGGEAPQLNQGAVSRLGAAGISVPGLGIGRTSPATTPSSPGAPVASAKAPSPSPVNQLQNRFSRMRTNSPTSSEAPSQAPTQGTTWAQKQAALNTVSSFNKDPSSVSLADARSAASTANNFRQRHGEQVASGMQTAQKYGVFDKAASLASQSQGQGQGQSQAQSGLSGVSAAAGMLGKKKPPPPPPKKKPGLSPTTPTTPEGGADADVPPPVPMGTRPTY